MVRPIAELIKDKLAAEELELVPRSYDLIGSRDKLVAIVEIPEELADKKQLIGDAIIKLNKNVKSVLSKLSGRRGTFRLEDLELIAGESNTEVVHKEHGYSIRLDPRKVFFSPRELTERQRIASQVKPNENVLVMFSGAAPYPICIAKKQPLVNKIYGIEINPDAHRYAVENVRINKLSHKIVLINEDVRKVYSKLQKFDRVVMPFAVGAYEYLDVAFDSIRSNGIIHFYHIGPESDLFKEAEEKVKELNKMFEIVKKVKVLPYGTRYWKICLDVRASG